MSLRTVNIRALKDHLSAHLRDVKHGDVFLVTDRGRVVAELRSPSIGLPSIDNVAAKEQALAEQGLMRLGLANVRSAYGDPGVALEQSHIDDALNWSRGER